MLSYIAYEKGYSVYPGEYIPLQETEILHEELQHTKGISATIPIHMHDLVDYYKVEVSLPGVRREELMVSIQGGILSIEILPYHDLGPVEQNVIIPGHIDCEFVTASFLEGMLGVFLPKAKIPPGNIVYPVVIY